MKRGQGRAKSSIILGNLIMSLLAGLAVVSFSPPLVSNLFVSVSLFC